MKTVVDCIRVLEAVAEDLDTAFLRVSLQLEDVLGSETSVPPNLPNSDLEEAPGCKLAADLIKLFNRLMETMAHIGEVEARLQLGSNKNVSGAQKGTMARDRPH